MNAAGRIGLLGGTLDPIHLGHVETAKAARAALGLERVTILPSRVPPHRALQPIASRYHRFAMSALAVNGVDGLAVSDLELCAPGPSYTADTLTRFRESSGLAASQVFFITGADAFAEIATWHRYPEVLGLANFVVVSRPGFPAEAMRERLRELGGTMITVPGSGFGVPGSGSGFGVPGSGSGFGVPGSGSGFGASGSGSGFGASGSGSGFGASGLQRIFLVDASTPDVSSTEVRRRLDAGEPLNGLVPASVEAHIRQHGLYRKTSAIPAADHLHGQN
jgi:nicotinate-nucleotide adenylyltransferase